jgi:hypothetical protein
MAFSNFAWDTVPTLHISYHLGEHYNSVRLMEDPGDGPAMPISHELKLVDDSVFNDKDLFPDNNKAKKDDGSE